MNVKERRLGYSLLSPRIVSDSRGKFIIPFLISNHYSCNFLFKKINQLNHSLTNDKGTVKRPNYQELFLRLRLLVCKGGALYSRNLSRRSRQRQMG